MAAVIKTSVIISTYNGAHKILNLLYALSIQTVLPDEVIIVVDGSTDNSIQLLNENRSKYPYIKVVWQLNGGRAKVRNRGVLEASNELLIFFDDDMRPIKDCIEMHVHHHLTHSESILTGGTKEEILPTSADIFCFKSSLSDKWNHQLLNYSDTPMPKEFSFITAANFSLSKSSWLLLNGFDERLTDAEDYDLAIRAAQINIPMYYNIKAFAWHDDFVTCRRYIKRLREYKDAHLYLQKIKPDLYPLNHKYAVLLPSGLKSIFFKLFCSSVWIDSVDANIWKYILPRKIRYRLYDWILTANSSFYPHKVTL